MSNFKKTIEFTGLFSKIHETFVFWVAGNVDALWLGSYELTLTLESFSKDSSSIFRKSKLFPASPTSLFGVDSAMCIGNWKNKTKEFQKLTFWNAVSVHFTKHFWPTPSNEWVLEFDGAKIGQSITSLSVQWMYVRWLIRLSQTLGRRAGRDLLY